MARVCFQSATCGQPMVPIRTRQRACRRQAMPNRNSGGQMMLPVPANLCVKSHPLCPYTQLGRLAGGRKKAADTTGQRLLRSSVAGGALRLQARLLHQFRRLWDHPKLLIHAEAIPQLPSFHHLPGCKPGNQYRAV